MTNEPNRPPCTEDDPAGVIGCSVIYKHAPRRKVLHIVRHSIGHYYRMSTGESVAISPWDIGESYMCSYKIVLLPWSDNKMEKALSSISWTRYELDEALDTVEAGIRWDKEDE